MTAPVTGQTQTAAQTAAAASGNYSNPKGTLDKDAFLQLLVAQMKNQDPLNPSGGDQMAAQLAQFSSLEQLQNINSTLQTQTTNGAGIIDSIQTSAALGTVGKTVVANGDGVTKYLRAQISDRSWQYMRRFPRGAGRRRSRFSTTPAR